MVNIDRVEDLLKEKGWKRPFFCEKMGHARSWVADWKQGKGLPDENALIRMAELLDTTVDYLTGKTDNKKPATNEGDGRAEYFLKLFKNVSPEQQDALIAMLEASQPKK